MIEVRLQTLKGSKNPQSFTFRIPQILIGRSKGCHVRVPSGKVSRQHCRLDIQDGSLILKDLNSSNGTFLNGARITRNCPLYSGDQFSVGPVTFQVHYTLFQPEPSPFDGAPIPDAEDVPMSGFDEAALSFDDESIPAVDNEPFPNVEEVPIPVAEDEIVPFDGAPIPVAEDGILPLEEHAPVLEEESAPVLEEEILPSFDDDEANTFADGTGDPLDLLGAIEAGAVEDDSPGQEKLDEDWTVPLDENAQDFLSQFDSEEGR